MNIYVAGPMRSKPEANFGEFDRARERLIGLGHRVFCPAMLARACQINPQEHHDKSLLRYVMQVDLACVATVDAIALLPEWEDSMGASVELAFAQFLDLPIYDALTMDRVYPPVKPWKYSIEVFKEAHELGRKEGHENCDRSYQNASVNCNGSSRCALVSRR